MSIVDCLNEALYPSAFKPAKYQKIKLMDGRVEEIPKVSLTLNQWKGAHITNTFGCKPIVEYAGEWMFAELAIKHKVTETKGWSAQWIEGKYYLERWVDTPFEHQDKKLVGELPPSKLLSDIDSRCCNLYSAHKPGSYSGCWDVLAWNDDGRILFIESKRRNKDRIRDTQRRWLTSALQIGLPRCDFLIVEWDYPKEEGKSQVKGGMNKPQILTAGNRVRSALGDAQKNSRSRASESQFFEKVQSLISNTELRDAVGVLYRFAQHYNDEGQGKVVWGKSQNGSFKFVVPKSGRTNMLFTVNGRGQLQINVSKQTGPYAKLLLRELRASSIFAELIAKKGSQGDYYFKIEDWGPNVRELVNIFKTMID
ncbi:MAG: hypothetical protein AB1351_10115 [Thermoproteota archaeon]